MDDKLLLEWIKEVNKEFQNTRDHIDTKINELKDEVRANREEFVIFKTRVSTRTAMISGIIGFVALVLSIAINLTTLQDKLDGKQDKTEQTINK